MLDFIKKWWKNLFKKYELVEFYDGTFGIRNISTNTYQDFHSLNFWWPSTSEWFNHCKTSEYEAEQRYHFLSVKYDPIKRVVK